MVEGLGIGLNIILDGDNCWPELREKGWIEGKLVAVAALVNGTVEGNPTVTLRIELPDGQTVLAQTTLRLFNGAARAFRGRFGEP
jgi:hypothetical protein